MADRRVVADRRTGERCDHCGQTVKAGTWRMVWSARLQRYVRWYMNDEEFAEYDRRGSID